MAYLERKKFEAKVIWAALGEAMSKGGKSETTSLSELAMMGFGIRGA